MGSKQRLENKLQRHPTPHEIALELGLTAKEVVEIEQRGQYHLLSLNQPVGFETSEEFGNTIPDEASELIHDTVLTDISLTPAIEKIFRPNVTGLKEVLHQQILSLRYGIHVPWLEKTWVSLTERPDDNNGSEISYATVFEAGGQTHAELATKLNVSTQAIREIENQAVEIAKQKTKKVASGYFIVS